MGRIHLGLGLATFHHPVVGHRHRLADRWRDGSPHVAAGSGSATGTDSSRGAGGDTCPRPDRPEERGRLSRSVPDVAKSARQACAGAGGEGVMRLCDRHVPTGND